MARELRVLRRDMQGPDVERWQLFLRGQGFAIVADAKFGPKTEAATKAFQRRWRLADDGIVGNQTMGRALMLGLALIVDDDLSKRGPNWPPKPTDLQPFTSTKERHAVFGAFRWEPAPTPRNPEAIRILGSWAKDHIIAVELPQLVTAGVRRTARVWVHREIAKPLKDLWQAWETKGLLSRVLSFEGTYVARRMRGGAELSNHAFGTAFDINAKWNRLGAVPALVGEQGCVRELVPLANKHGFFWGGHFERRKDGMHFEWGKRA